MADPIKPLNDEHLAMIRDGLDKIKEAKLAISAARRAGIEGMDDRDKEVIDLERKLTQIKGVYFPGK